MFAFSVRAQGTVGSFRAQILCPAGGSKGLSRFLNILMMQFECRNFCRKRWFSATLAETEALQNRRKLSLAFKLNFLQSHQKHFQKDWCLWQSLCHIWLSLKLWLSVNEENCIWYPVRPSQQGIFNLFDMRPKEVAAYWSATATWQLALALPLAHSRVPTSFQNTWKLLFCSHDLENLQIWKSSLSQSRKKTFFSQQISSFFVQWKKLFCSLKMEKFSILPFTREYLQKEWNSYKSSFMAQLWSRIAL